MNTIFCFDRFDLRSVLQSLNEEVLIKIIKLRNNDNTYRFLVICKEEDEKKQ